MTLWVPLFFGVVALLLARSNHPALGLLIGGLVIAWMVAAPFLENSISSYRIRRPGPPPRRPRRR
ncbi:MAG: hypothetical protein WCO00_12910 [Rhodospirillaceae bacterium]